MLRHQKLRWWGLVYRRLNPLRFVCPHEIFQPVQIRIGLRFQRICYLSDSISQEAKLALPFYFRLFEERLQSEYLSIEFLCRALDSLLPSSKHITDGHYFLVIFVELHLELGEKDG